MQFSGAHPFVLMDRKQFVTLRRTQLLFFILV